MHPGRIPVGSYVDRRWIVGGVVDQVTYTFSARSLAASSGHDLFGR